MKIRIYELILYKYKITKELSAIIYNNFLVLSSTTLNSDFHVNNSNYYSIINDIDNYCFSILIIFGYYQEKNRTINDITDCFLNDIITIEKNIIIKFNENIKIDNNIFGYEIVEQIKLVNIPEEILFFNENNQTKLSNGDILNKKYSFNPNLDSVKSDIFYYLEYQNILKEPDYDKFNTYPIKIINCSSQSPSTSIDQRDFYTPKIFYGKKMTAKFKLCKDFCSCCKKDGNYIIHDNCQICIPTTIP